MKVVYKQNDVAVNAFILERGILTFSLPSGGEFTLEGQNVVFGVAEMLLSWDHGKLANRLFSVLASDDASWKPVPKDNLRSLIEHFNIGFNIARGIAHSLREVNLLIQKKLDARSDRQKKSQGYAKAYADVIDQLKADFDKYRFPILKQLHDDFANSLTYQYGISFRRLAPKAVIRLEEGSLASLRREYQSGQTLCKQGDTGDELYVLQAGTLGVYVGAADKAIARIDHPGEVIGEMSLLLNEPRTATMKAETALVLTVVRKADLQQVAESRPDFLHQIGLTLAKRVETNVDFLAQLCREPSTAEGPELLFEDPHHDQYQLLERALEKARHGKDLPVLRELVDRARRAKTENT